MAYNNYLQSLGRITPLINSLSGYGTSANTATDPASGGIGGSSIMFPNGQPSIGYPSVPATPVSPYTGQPDYLAGMSTASGLSSDALGAATDSGGGNWFSNLHQSMMDSGFLGSTQNGIKTDGWGGLAVGAGTGLLNAFMGMQQYGLAKDSLAASKEEFNTNFAAQQKTTNANMADRQAARVASDPGAYQSVSSYMAKNGI